MKFEVPKNFIDVLLPLSLPKAYTYYLSEEQASLVRPGFRIAVPFGKQKIYTAIAKRLHKVAPQTYEPKPIVMIIDDFPVVTENQLEFWKWLSDYYMCSEGEVLRASLPSALLIESQTIIVKCEVNQNQLDSLSNTQYIVYEALQKQSLTIEEIIKITDLKRAMPLITDMIEKKVAMIYQRFEEKFKPKIIRVVQLSKAYNNEKKLENILKNLKRAPKQKAIIMVFLSKGNDLSSWITINSLKEKAQVNSAPIKSLLKKGILIESYQEINRKLVRNIDEKVENKNLSFSQSKALIELKIELQKKGVVLFEGVTASGKTEVYIELIQEQIKQGKQVLYLLPEISLTSQIVARLNLRFGNKVLVYHSRFSIHERTEVWNQVLNSNQNGQIIVGARSAILLPFRNLGLVIVDEEHENSYKQFDPAPRYHARDSVIYLSKKKKAGVVLGSATPSIETAENAINGKYGWVKLKERYGGVALPQIELIDLKKAHRKKKMKGFFTNELFAAISLTISQGKQVILFQNRRGYAPILECESCGHCPQCAQCDVSLTYHQKQNQLRCHYCGYNIPFPSQCHACGMTTLTTKGVGTQQIEEQLIHHFPGVNVERMDWDSTRGKWDFDKIIRKFDK